MKTIRGKMSVILALSISGLIIILGFNFLYLFLNNQTEEERTQLLDAVYASKDIKEKFSSSRALDQSYLRQPNEERATQTKVQINELLAQNDTYIEQFEQLPEIQQYFITISEELNRYRQQFSSLETLISDIGYSSEEGMNGDVQIKRNELSVLVAESNNSTLINQFNTLQDAENEYMRTKDDDSYYSYVSLSANYKYTVSNNIEDPDAKQKVLTAVTDYQEALKYVNFNYKQQNVITETFANIAQTIEESVAEVESNVTFEANKLTEEVDRNNQVVLWSIVGVSVLLIIGISLTVYYISNNIVKSVRSVKKGAEKIGNGDLTYRVDVSGKDELAQLAETFNRMAEKVQQSLLKIMNSSLEIQSSSQNLTAIAEQTTAQSNEVANAIKQVAAGASEQTIQLEEGTVIIKNVSSAIEQTDKISKEIALSAAESESEGKNGLKTVHELEETNNHFNMLSNQLIEQVETVTTNFQEISNIIETIEEIAENTNLLSLNAAIESARAGEAGRGFAVVANEVRKLAARSKEETQHIYKIVSSLNEQMQVLTENAEKFNQYREVHGQTVILTKKAFDNIVEHVKNISGKVQNVNEAVKNVQNANLNLSYKLDEIHSISEQSAGAAEEVSASSETQMEAIVQVSDAAISLSEISTLLQQEISQFEITSNEQQPINIKTPAAAKMDRKALLKVTGKLKNLLQVLTKRKQK